jgi:hypothetical protein
MMRVRKNSLRYLMALSVRAKNRSVKGENKFD